MEALSEKLSQMNEAEMSDEDKRDNQVLRRIYNKIQRRANVDLTSDEQAVLDKYHITFDEYEDIAKQLEAVLDVGPCGWCV